MCVLDLCGELKKSNNSFDVKANSSYPLVKLIQRPFKRDCSDFILGISWEILQYPRRTHSQLSGKVKAPELLQSAALIHQVFHGISREEKPFIMGFNWS